MISEDKLNEIKENYPPETKIKLLEASDAYSYSKQSSTPTRITTHHYSPPFLLPDKTCLALNNKTLLRAPKG